MKKELEKLKRAFHINIFDSFFDQENAIIDDYFLVDNLHLSRSGYEIWRKEIQKFLSRELRFASK
jgi:lysophospholipase L1-like esterase